MIEVTLELRLDSFLVNSVGGGDELTGTMPARAVRFRCEKIAAARQLAGGAPSVDFDFLGSASQHASQSETDNDFDGQLLNYLTMHTTMDVSKVTLASGASGYSTLPKGVSSGEIGRMLFAKSPSQSRVEVELVLDDDGFAAVWALTAEQKIQQAVIVLSCFKLEQDSPVPHSNALFVTGILTSSLRMIPRSGN